MRFTGTCEELGPVDHRGLADWVSVIDLAVWPQQTPAADGSLRPAMVTDLLWFGFGRQTDALVGSLLRQHFPGCCDRMRMLSVLMPGDSIPPHIDYQDDAWVARVHVPLATSDSLITVGGEQHRLSTGHAYLFNATLEHSSENRGAWPRIHLMFDVKW